MSETFTARNPNIDAVRGLAVLGIFFLNILFMGNSLDGYTPTEPAASSDMGVEIFSRMFLEGRFIGLFTLLFGVGLAIQYQGFSQQTANPFMPIKKRLKVLMVLGLLHGIFIWPGDVLLTYGLSALLALSYLESPLHQIRSRLILFIFISLVSMLALTQAVMDEPLPSRGSEQYWTALAPWIGSYPEQLIQHLMQMLIVNLMILPIAILWYVAGMMLLGIYLYRSGFFETGFAPSARVQVQFAAIAFVAVDLLLFHSKTPAIKALSQATVVYSAIPVALLYADLIIRLCNGRAAVLSGLQKVGKLALSLYVLQSVMGILCFRYLFVDWLQSFDRIDYLLTATLWAVCQMLLAAGYLKLFNQGPLERLWRYLAFGSATNKTDSSEVNP
ncbi:DUF418 domain-containing protein [Shewanella sp.]|uniref:DUF418 domain-containing protein n=1 Tax=Shewanella sp. TaxID=50422 RepID=UPI00356B2953